MSRQKYDKNLYYPDFTSQTATGVGASPSQGRIGDFFCVMATSFIAPKAVCVKTYSSAD
jgi:hypothetical protein